MKQVEHVRWMCVALGALLTSLFFAPASRAQNPTSPSEVPPSVAAAPAYREFVDETGRTVRVPQPVKRIVSLAPSLTETIYALNLQDELVGDTDYCDYPPDAQKKTKVGGPINPSIEQIVALKPDVVLVTKSLNKLPTVQALENLGIAAYATDPKNISDILTSTEKLADMLGAPEAGKSLSADLERKLNDLQQHLSGIPPRRVLFVVWAEPLQSIGKNTFIADALRRAGAVSIIDSQQDWPLTSLEEVIHQQPDFLVFPVTHSDSSASDPEVITARPGWRDLEAVKKHHFATISEAINRPAPRIISAIEDLAHQLHPEAFAEKTSTDKEKIEKQNPQPPRSSTSLAFPRFFREDADATIEQKECACAL